MSHGDAHVGAAVDTLLPVAGEPMVATQLSLAISPTLLAQLLEASKGLLAVNSQRNYTKSLTIFENWFRDWLPKSSQELQSALLSQSSDDVVQNMFVAMLRAGPLVSNIVVAEFANSLAKTCASATIANRLCAVRWIFRVAREAGVVQWELHVRSPKVEPYRDTRGPGLSVVKRLLLVAGKQERVIAARDTVLVHLLWDLALRRAEVSALNVADFDSNACILSVIGKGKSQKTPLTLPAVVVDALKAYLATRKGLEPTAPLLLNHDRSEKGSRRLLGGGVYHRVRYLAKLAKVDAAVSPHRVRHSSITESLDANNGDVRSTRAFARHANANTTLGYDDRRQDVGGQVAQVLADLLTGSEG